MKWQQYNSRMIIQQSTYGNNDNKMMIQQQINNNTAVEQAYNYSTPLTRFPLPCWIWLSCELTIVFPWWYSCLSSNLIVALLSCHLLLSSINDTPLPGQIIDVVLPQWYSPWYLPLSSLDDTPVPCQIWLFYYYLVTCSYPPSMILHSLVESSMILLSLFRKFVDCQLRREYHSGHAWEWGARYGGWGGDLVVIIGIIWEHSLTKKNFKK